MFAISTPDSITAAKLIAAALDRLTDQLKALEIKMDEALEELRVEIEKTNGTAASAVKLIEFVVSQLQQHAGEEAVVRELAASLKSGTQPLADAVASTPVP